MALLTDGVQNLGSFYCLIRRRFKRRRKKRSERKGKASSQPESPRLGSCSLEAGLKNSLKSDFFLPQKLLHLENGSMVQLRLVMDSSFLPFEFCDSDQKKSVCVFSRRR